MNYNFLRDRDISKLQSIQANSSMILEVFWRRDTLWGEVIFNSTIRISAIIPKL
jgi:hypothetical protein